MEYRHVGQKKINLLKQIYLWIKKKGVFSTYWMQDHNAL